MSGVLEMKEFNLSEKRIEIIEEGFFVYPEKDVKEFIKRDWDITNYFLWDLLRNNFNVSIEWIEKMITELKIKKDKLAGDKLK